jgi:hypothetical protein
VYRDLPTNDELLTEINSKLNALLDAMLEGQSRQPGFRTPSHAMEYEGHSESLSALLDERQTGMGAPPSPPPRPSSYEYGAEPLSSQRLTDALEEIAKLLALNLKRKRDLEEVVADLDAVGFDRARIGELLGASPSRVDAALAMYDRRARKKQR